LEAEAADCVSSLRHLIGVRNILHDSATIARSVIFLEAAEGNVVVRICQAVTVMFWRQAIHNLAIFIASTGKPTPKWRTISSTSIEYLVDGLALGAGEIHGPDQARPRQREDVETSCDSASTLGWRANSAVFHVIAGDSDLEWPLVADLEPVAVDARELALDQTRP
jgi:hypothetical protein